MLKNASEVTLVPKNILFLKILNLFVQSFAECKVSLADSRVKDMQFRKLPVPFNPK
jgi:hypothetical protein